jgi:hypothetical protein
LPFSLEDKTRIKSYRGLSFGFPDAINHTSNRLLPSHHLIIDPVHLSVYDATRDNVRIMRVLNVIFVTILVFSLAACRDSAKTTGFVGTFNMGERAQVGPLIYTIFDTQWAISLGEGTSQRIPGNRFLMINLSVVNSGGSANSSVPTFTLIEDSGQTYQELDNGEGIRDWMGFVRRVRPAESLQGIVAFDVPQKRFKLRVADENERYAYINIPLTLGDAPPDLAPKTPGSK